MTAPIANASITTESTSLLGQWASGIGEVHLILAIILFYLINAIGKRSVTLGYKSVSLYMQQETAPAFNFVLRVVSPTVYLIIIASLFYASNLDIFTINLYYVIVYYILFRLSYNVLLGQPRLINWKRQIVYSILMLLISYLAYIKLIIIKKNLLPDFSNLANELWVIIILFIYNLVNDIDGSDEKSIKRKDNYVEFIYTKLVNNYDSIIKTEVKNELARFIVYAVMIHENYNRPLLARKLEVLHFILTKKPHTFGIMQVYFKVPLTDEQSVHLGAKRLNKAYTAAYQAITERTDDGKIPTYYLHSAITEVISSYNTGEDYTNEVYELLETLVLKHNKKLAEEFIIE